MSSYMMKPERIAQLADYISALNNMGYDFFGYDIPESLHDSLLDCLDTHGFMITALVYDKLSALNMRAVCGRYNSEPIEIDDIPTYTGIYKQMKQGKDDTVESWYQEIEPWHYELLKLTQCFLYQCNEDATDNDPLYKGLIELERRQAFHIVQNSPLYVKAIWG